MFASKKEDSREDRGFSFFREYFRPHNGVDKTRKGDTMSFATDCKIAENAPKFLRKDVIEYYVEHAPDAVAREYCVKSSYGGSYKNYVEACSNAIHGVMKGGFVLGCILTVAACGQSIYKIGKGVYKLVKIVKR